MIDDAETIYLDGNSLGRLPHATRERTSLVDQWGTELERLGRLDRVAARVGDLIAEAVLGARLAR